MSPPESDALYGDGHVEMHGKLVGYVYRSHATTTYSY